MAWFSGRAAAFTLVELMVVVAILALLVGIIAPSVSGYYLAARNTTTRVRIGMIDAACEMYHNDFNDYPPSDDANLTGWLGSELIVLFLTGYGGDGGAAGNPEGALDDDDGKVGFGFRVAARGYVYGPYNGTERIETKRWPAPDANDRPEFIDAFDNPILYYRFDGGYDVNDNPDGPDTQVKLDAYAKDPTGTHYSRRDFMLCSPGFDSWRKARSDLNWNDPASPSASDDDITNFGGD